MKTSGHKWEKDTPKPWSPNQKAVFHTKTKGKSFLSSQFTPALPVHILLTKTWAFSTRNSNLWIKTDLDKSKLYHTRQEPRAQLRGGSHFKASFHLNTNRVNNWQSEKQIPSRFSFQMACSSSSPPPPPPAPPFQSGSLVEMHPL